MKSKDHEIFHHHLFSAKTQRTIVNFFKRRVGKTFSPATFLPSESQSNSMQDQGFLKLAGQQGCVCHLSWSLRPTLTSPERWQLNISTIGAQLLWQERPQGDHIELMFRQHHQDISFADQHWERVDSFQFGVDYVNCEQGTDSGYCLCYCLHGRCMSECTVIVSKLPVLTITIQVMRWAGQESVTDGAQEEESRMQVECCGTLKNEGWWIICWPSSQED